MGHSYLWLWKSVEEGTSLFHEFFNAKSVANFDGHQRKYVHRFLSCLSQTPDDFLDHIQLWVSFRSACTGLTFVLSSVTGALIMEITYGLDIKSHEDQFLQAVEHAIEYTEKVMVPAAFLVDALPICTFSS